VSEADRLCLGDWSLARGVELSIEYQLPFKIHTGSFAGTGPLPVDILRAGHLWELLTLYPQARFVLMHIAYPYNDELVALVKHYPNAYADLCWAWSLDPYSASDFVRRCLHTAPSNKLFIFGGDTYWPSMAVAFAAQARDWFTRTLQAEVDEGLLSEGDAIDLATQLMRDNQYAFFRVAEKREVLLKHYRQNTPERTEG
jgi:predicted TIM-barrel fold metal-dependent hydrolase